MKHALKEMDRSDLVGFYLKSTLKKQHSYVVIHYPNLIPGAVEDFNAMFGIKITPSDEAAIIQVSDAKKARSQCEEVHKEYSLIAFDLWEKGKRVQSWG